MPRLKKKEEPSPPVEPTVTLTAGRSRRTIKPNRKYLNDSVVLATTSIRSSSPDSDASEDDYNQQEDDDDEVIPPKSAAGRKSSGSAAAKKPSPAATSKRGRPPKGITKTEPVKNLRKEVLKKMDLSTLNMGRARVVLTPINKDIKRKLDLDISLVKDKTPFKGKPPMKLPEKQPPKQPEIQPPKQPEKQALKQPEKQAPKQPEKPKPKVLLKTKEQEKLAKPEKEKPAPVKVVTEEKSKPKNILFKRKQPDAPAPTKPEPVVVPKKFVNPVALQKQKLEKSILDKRHRKPEENSLQASTDEAGGDDDDDEVQIVGVSRGGGGATTGSNVVAGRKSLRKSPLIAKQISPIARKVIKPAAVVSKITPPTAAGPKRKPTADSSADDKAVQQARKKGRFSKEPKLSITIDSDDLVEDSDEEPVRRSTRSSMVSDKSSAASTPQSASVKAKDSSAPTKLTKDSLEVSKGGTMSKSVSLPALDKTKMSGRSPGFKPGQTPAIKGLAKPIAQSTPKPTSGAGALAEKKSKSEVNLVDPIRSLEKDRKQSGKGTTDNATIRIVSVGDILNKKAASTPDVRKAAINRKSSQEDEYLSSDSDDSDDYLDAKTGSTEKPKTNNQLVATILGRKRAINLDHLRINRPPKRGRSSGASKQTPVEKPGPKASVVNLATEDEVDFEDMLQTNIVTAHKVQKIVASSPPVARARGRPPGTLDENFSRTAEAKSLPLNKSPAAAAGVKTLASNNNNNLYKAYNNGRPTTTTILNRSGSTSPQKNPPRILNSTMKLGDNRPFAKLVANSGNKHYSIDLTDPDNNVKLVVSQDSPPTSPVKQQQQRSPVKTTTVPRPIVASAGGLRNTSNALNKPIGGAVQRSISAITSSSGSNAKMKKITCYETWYVINIPNTENKPERPSFSMSMIGLGNEAANIQLPSSEWSHKIILTKRKVLPGEGEEVFSGDVEDRAITEEEKRNYEPCNIMFRRRTATPGKFNLQYDRAVIFKNDTFFINVDGKNCTLVGAPCRVNGTQDIETLLSVVDYVNLKNSCVELSAG